MSDLISRQAAIDGLQTQSGNDFAIRANEADSYTEVICKKQWKSSLQRY